MINKHARNLILFIIIKGMAIFNYRANQCRRYELFMSVCVCVCVCVCVYVCVCVRLWIGEGNVMTGSKIDCPQLCLQFRVDDPWA